MSEPENKQYSIAVLISGDQVQAMRDAMAEASCVILDGFKLRTDAELIRFPQRHRDDRGVAMWETVMDLLDSLERGAA